MEAQIGIKMKIFLDDVREPPIFDSFTGEKIDWVVIRTASECIEAIKQGNVEYISFDHDLGNDEDGTGYDVAKFIEKQAFTNAEMNPIDYAVHSANPIGANNIDAAMKKAWQIWEKESKK